MTKNVAMFGVLAALVAVAAWRFNSHSRDSRPPDTPETVTHWMCESCGFIRELTARAQHDWSNDPERVRRMKEYGNRRTVFKCEKCDDYKLVRAGHCKRHDEWYCSLLADGGDGDCPECLKLDRKP